MQVLRDWKIYVSSQEDRRWLHLCCVNEGEQDRQKVRGRNCQCVFVSFITQQQFCFRGHLKLTAGLISSGDSLLYMCACLCVCSVFWKNALCLWMRRMCRDHQSGSTMLTSYFMTGIAAQKYHFGFHESLRKMHINMHIRVHFYLYILYWWASCNTTKCSATNISLTQT